MDIKEFIKIEGRESLTKEFTKEGLFELKEETIRGNKYHVFANLPQTLRDIFNFHLYMESGIFWRMRMKHIVIKRF